MCTPTGRDINKHSSLGHIVDLFQNVTLPKDYIKINFKEGK